MSAVKRKSQLQMVESGNNIKTGSGMWSFGDSVCSVFDDHIKASIPCYEEAHSLICSLCDSFITNGSKIYDIGCSTGTLSRKIYKEYNHRSINIVGYDVEQNMVEKANIEKFDILNSDLENTPSSLSYTCSNAFEAPLDDADVITSIYTVQFIHPSVRQELINRVYKSLRWGGAFFMFEKVRAPDARFQDKITLSYNRYKLESFSSEEVLGKSIALSGILEPFSSDGNIGLLERAGFKDHMIVFKYLCFEGFLAIK